jgi:hypothetical protein
MSSTIIISSPRIIPVYRFNQSTLTSPCVLGSMCDVCRQHAPCAAGKLCGDCRRQRPHSCERATAAAPAFHVTRRAALALIWNLLARFVLSNTAIQLNYAGLENLRDESSHVDHSVILAYVSGMVQTRNAVDLAWSAPPAAVAKQPPIPTFYPFV